MKIISYAREYEVTFYDDLSFIDELLKLDNTFLVIDTKVFNLYDDNIFKNFSTQKLFLLDALEENKTIEKVLEICEELTKISAKKNVNLISFGGGIIQDITGFVANILYRGINWHYVPTTLLAQADSCIGSKTSLNYLKYKNLLGTFYPPNKVYIYPNFLLSLKKDDFLSGLGEVVKFNIMASKDNLSKIEKDIDLLMQLNYSLLKQYIINSHEFKRTFVEQDEFDRGIRKQLNFAHTFGHALEVLSGYQIPHGQAVSIGTLIANRVSLSRRILLEETCCRIEVLIKQIISVPLSPHFFNIPDMISIMRQDKKMQGSELTAIIIDEELKLHIVNDLKESEVASAVSYVFDFLK